jgi:hypothetical protein
MVLRQSMRLTAVGVVLGTLLALLTAKALSRSALGRRFDLFDAGGYVLGLLLVVATALAAAWIPARRAVNLDPARKLHTVRAYQKMYDWNPGTYKQKCCQIEINSHCVLSPGLALHAGA